MRVRGSKLALIAAVILAAAPAAAAPGGGRTPAEPPARAVDQIALEDTTRGLFADLSEGEYRNCDRIAPRLAQVARHPDFRRMSTGGQRQALIGLLVCINDYSTPEAIEWARRLDPLAASDLERALVAFPLLLIDYDAGRHLDAARRLVIVLDGSPGLVSHWDSATVWPLVNAADADPEFQAVLLRRLLDVEWDSSLSRMSARTGWPMRLARLQVGAGRLDEAYQSLARITDVEILLTVAADRRFAPLWPRLQAAGRFDWPSVAETDLAARRALAAQEPRSLFVLVDVMEALHLLGRDEEAIALGEAARRKLAGADAYEDQVDQAPWLFNALARSLDRAGRRPEAEAAYREGVIAGDRADDPVSIRLNLAAHLHTWERPAEGLAVLDQIPEDQLWAHAALWRDTYLACMVADVDRPRAERMLAAMRPREAENPVALGVALSCLDRIEEAAGVYVRRLNSPRLRDQALLTAAIGKAPFGSSAFDERQLANRRAIFARQDVLAAIERAGRRVETPLKGRYYPR